MTASATRFRDARQRAAGQVIVAALTANAAYGTDAADVLTDAGIAAILDDLDAYDVAGAAATIVGKILADVESVLGVSQAATIANVGTWVARGEIEEDG